jgi:hypothetical protein
MVEASIVRDLIAELAEEFLADRDAMTDRLVDRVHADTNVPGDAELRAATHEAGARIVEQLLAQLRDGADMSTVHPPRAAIEYAHEYAHRGIDLPVLLAVVRTGYAVFSRQWSDRLGASSSPSEVSVAALSTSLLEIFAYIDSISTAFAVAYSDERARWSRSLEALRLDIVRSILDGGTIDEALAAQRLGHRLDVPQRAFVVWSDADPALGLRDALEAAAGEIVTRAGADLALVVPFRGQVLAGWVAGRAATVPDERVVGESFPAPSAFDVRGALGMPGDGIAGFRASHRQALHARRVASAGDAGAGRITSYTEVALAALASADPEHAREFVDTELAELAGGGEATRRIAATVRVYLEEGRSRARTARRLGVHTNTIAYRLARAAELLGHSLDDRAAEVQVALAIAPVVAAARDQPLTDPATGSL